MTSGWQVLRVFLSSPMHNETWLGLRAAVLELFETDPRCEPFVLYGIERNPAPGAPRDVYLAQVPESHVLVALLGSDRRQAVCDEVATALEEGIPVLALQDARLVPSQELQSWIEDVLHPVTTIGSYTSLITLCDELRQALIALMVGALNQRPAEGVQQLVAKNDIEGVSNQELSALKTDLADARLFSQGRPDEARSLYAEAKDLDPDNFTAVFRLAFLLDNFAPMDPQTALPLLRRALELRPGDPHVILNLALATEHSGDPAEAIPLYRSAEEAFGDSLRGTEAALILGKINLFAAGAIVASDSHDLCEEARRRVAAADRLLGKISSQAEAGHWLARVPSLTDEIEALCAG